MLLSILQIWTIYFQYVTPISTQVILSVHVGDTANLNCPVHSEDDGQWFRLKSDGTDSVEKLLAIGALVNPSLKGNERYTTYSNSTLYILRITNIEEDDGGRYQCHISGSPVLEFKIELLSQEDVISAECASDVTQYDSTTSISSERDVSSAESASDVTQYDSTASVSPGRDLKTTGIIVLSGSGLAVMLILGIIVKCVYSINHGLTTTADQTNSHIVNQTFPADPMYEEVQPTNNIFVSGEDQMRMQEEITGFIAPEGRLYEQNIRQETRQDMYESLSSERSDVHIYKDISNM